MDNSHILRNPSKNELINVIDQNMSDLGNTLFGFIDKDYFLKKNPDSEFSVNNELSKFITGIKSPLTYIR